MTVICEMIVAYVLKPPQYLLAMEIYELFAAGFFVIRFFGVFFNIDIKRIIL